MHLYCKRLFLVLSNITQLEPRDEPKLWMSLVKEVFVSVQYSSFRFNADKYLLQTSLFDVQLMKKEIAILTTISWYFMHEGPGQKQQDCKLH